jgi:hypothetical protein
MALCPLLERVLWRSVSVAAGAGKRPVCGDVGARCSGMNGSHDVALTSRNGRSTAHTGLWLRRELDCSPGGCTRGIVRQVRPLPGLPDDRWRRRETVIQQAWGAGLGDTARAPARFGGELGGVAPLVCPPDARSGGGPARAPDRPRWTEVLRRAEVLEAGRAVEPGGRSDSPSLDQRGALSGLRQLDRVTEMSPSDVRAAVTFGRGRQRCRWRARALLVARRRS